MTPREAIEAAFTEMGLLEPGDSLAPNDLTWGLGKFNRLLKSVSTAGVILHYRVTDNFTFTIGTASYTIGSGATIDTARPNVIERAYIKVDNIDYEIRVRPINEYHAISTKTVRDRPKWIYYDPTYANGTLYFYYTPNATETCYVVSQKPLTTYTDEDTDIVLPGEYEDGLVLKLAIQVAPRFGRRVSADLRLNATEAWGRIISRNLANTMKPIHLNITGTNRAYNINEG